MATSRDSLRTSGEKLSTQRQVNLSRDPVLSIIYRRQPRTASKFSRPMMKQLAFTNPSTPFCSQFRTQGPSLQKCTTLISLAIAYRGGTCPHHGIWEAPAKPDKPRDILRTHEHAPTNQLNAGMLTPTPASHCMHQKEGKMKKIS